MAVQLVCDGCKAEVPEDTQPRGLTIKAHYCPKCEKSVARYEHERDKLHTDLATSWQESLALLRQRWLEEHPDGRLPDE